MTMSRGARLFKYFNITAVHHIERLKKKTPTVVSIDTEKAFNSIQYPFMIEIMRKPRAEGNSPNWEKNIYRLPTANVILSGPRVNASPL